MGVGIQNCRHRGAFPNENGPSDLFAEQRDERGFPGPYAEVDVACAEAHVEQYVIAILFADGLFIRPDLGQHVASSADCQSVGNAERHAMLPSSGSPAERLVGERRRLIARAYPDRAAMGRNRETVGRDEGEQLAVVAMELGDRAERAYAEAADRLCQMLLENAFNVAQVGHNPYHIRGRGLKGPSQRRRRPATGNRRISPDAFCPPPAISVGLDRTRSMGRTYGSPSISPWWALIP